VDAKLRRHVVRLTEIADQARGRGHVHHRARFLLAEMSRDGARHVERAVEMHVDDVVPVRPTHAMKDAVAQDAGVVHQDVDAAELVDGGLHDRFGVLRLGDRERRGDRVAARSLDLLHDLLRGALIAA